MSMELAMDIDPLLVKLGFDGTIFDLLYKESLRVMIPISNHHTLYNMHDTLYNTYDEEYIRYTLICVNLNIHKYL